MEGLREAGTYQAFLELLDWRLEQNMGANVSVHQMQGSMMVDSKFSSCTGGGWRRVVALEQGSGGLPAQL
jgi:hypothetical protein